MAEMLETTESSSLISLFNSSLDFLLNDSNTYTRIIIMYSLLVYIYIYGPR